MAQSYGRAEVINYEGVDVVETLKQMTGAWVPTPNASRLVAKAEVQGIRQTFLVLDFPCSCAWAS